MENLCTSLRFAVKLQLFEKKKDDVNKQTNKIKKKKKTREADVQNKLQPILWKNA